jgi:hypothetical protein
MKALAERNILWVVWLVLLAAFALFVALIFGLPRAGRAYVRHATVALESNLLVPAGDIEVCAPACMRRGAGEEARVEEGAEIRPLGGGASSAIVRFFDGSQVTLEGHGRLVLERTRRPRFSVGDAPRSVYLRFERGERGAAAAPAVLRLGTRYDDSPERKREFIVDTPNARLHVAPETHARLELGDDGLRVYHEAGEGTLEVEGKGALMASSTEPGRSSVVLEVGERTVVGPDGLPAPVLADPEPLVSGGEFDPGGEGRSRWQRIPPAVAFVSPPVGDWLVDEEGRSLLRLSRTEAQKSPADIVLRQDLPEVALGDAAFLALTATLRLKAQSLPGGGDRAEEYPLRLTLVAVDEQGDEFAWSVGFYALAPDPEAAEFAGARVDPLRSRLVPFGLWTTFDSGNLLDANNPLGFAQLPQPRQAVALKRIEIKASGHDFTSELDAVQVLWK